MRLSVIVPTMLGFVSLFFIVIGIWYRNTYAFAPNVVFLLGVIFFLLAGQVTGVLRKKEEEKEN